MYEYLLFDWFGLCRTSKSLLIEHKQSSWFQTSQTGGQLYSDNFPYEYGSASCETVTDMSQEFDGHFKVEYFKIHQKLYMSN